MTVSTNGRSSSSKDRSTADMPDQKSMNEFLHSSRSGWSPSFVLKETRWSRSRTIFLIASFQWLDRIPFPLQGKGKKDKLQWWATSFSFCCFADRPLYALHVKMLPVPPSMTSVYTFISRQWWDLHPVAKLFTSVISFGPWLWALTAASARSLWKKKRWSQPETSSAITDSKREKGLRGEWRCWYEH